MSENPAKIVIPSDLFERDPEDLMGDAEAVKRITTYYRQLREQHMAEAEDKAVAKKKRAQRKAEKEGNVDPTKLSAGDD